MDNPIIWTLIAGVVIVWALWKYVLPKFDLNHDGKVDKADLDINKDGKVNSADAVKAVNKATRTKKVATKAATKTRAKK